MIHKHRKFNITTQYFNDRPNIVVEAKCTSCGDINWPLMKIMQDRENKQFDLLAPPPIKREKKQENKR